jgi:SET domain-containing protein
MSDESEKASRGGPRVFVAQNRHGQGVYAGRPIDDGQIVDRIKGRIIDDPDYGSDYCMDLGEGLSLEPDAPFRYLNHSCEPNCELVFYDSKGRKNEQRRPTLWLQALMEIPAGSELTIDYGWPSDAAQPCECGSRECRGWIVDAEEVLQVKAERN